MNTKTKVTRIVPPLIVGRMSGAFWADVYASGKVRLTYEDGETESANLTKAQLDEGRENFFSLVGHVQSYRPNTTISRLAVNANQASTATNQNKKQLT